MYIYVLNSIVFVRWTYDNGGRIQKPNKIDSKHLVSYPKYLDNFMLAH